MSSCEEGQQGALLQTPTTHHQFPNNTPPLSTPRSKKTAILLAVVAGVAVIAAATCAVLAVSLGSRASADGDVTADTQPVQERQLVCLHFRKSNVWCQITVWNIYFYEPNEAFSPYNRVVKREPFINETVYT